MAFGHQPEPRPKQRRTLETPHPWPKDAGMAGFFQGFRRSIPVGPPGGPGLAPMRHVSRQTLSEPGSSSDVSSSKAGPKTLPPHGPVSMSHFYGRATVPWLQYRNVLSRETQGIFVQHKIVAIDNEIWIVYQTTSTVSENTGRCQRTRVAEQECQSQKTRTSKSENTNIEVRC